MDLISMMSTNGFPGIVEQTTRTFWGP